MLDGCIRLAAVGDGLIFFAIFVGAGGAGGGGGGGGGMSGFFGLNTHMIS